MKNYDTPLECIEEVRTHLWRALKLTEDKEVQRHIWDAGVALFKPQIILEEWDNEQDIEMAEVAKSFGG